VKPFDKLRAKAVGLNTNVQKADVEKGFKQTSRLRPRPESGAKYKRPDGGR